MSIETVDGAAAAFVAGLVTSLHCVGMCGPLACGLATLRGTDADRRSALMLYQAGRVLSYGLVGALSGWLGSAIVARLTGGPAMLLPWFLAGVLLIYGFGLERRLPRPLWLRRLTGGWRLRWSRAPARYGGLGLGLITPLLPCGPLYLMLGIALLSGSAWGGAETMLAFALGTLPLLWIGQHQFRHWHSRLPPHGLMFLRRGLALTAALVLMWRLRETWWFADAAALPSCCH